MEGAYLFLKEIVVPIAVALIGGQSLIASSRGQAPGTEAGQPDTRPSRVIRRVLAVTGAALILCAMAAAVYGTISMRGRIVRVENNLVNPEMSMKWNGHRYAVIERSCSWTIARQLCELLGGHLAVIETAEEQGWISTTLLAGGTRACYWIGATDEEEEGHWRWVTGDDLGWVLKDESGRALGRWQMYTNWADGEPNDYSGEQDFAILLHNPDLSTNRQWDDIRDEGSTSPGNPTANLANIGFICEWEHE